MKRDYPLVSICIPSFNYGEYIADAVDSAIAQTYPNIEVLISDNCSTDSTFEVLSRYADNPRVVVSKNAKNFGMVRNHNLAVKRASGEYVVVLSADDVLFPNHVSLLMERVLDTQDPVDIVYANAMMLDEKLHAQERRRYRGTLDISYSGRDGFADVLTNFYHALQAMVIPKRVYEELGYFDETIAYAFDVDFCARMEFAEYRIGFIPDIVAGFRNHKRRSSIGEWQTREPYLKDKAQYLEKFIRPENAWRLEGCETALLSILHGEAAQAECTEKRPLEPELRARLTAITDTLETMRTSRAVWPTTRPRVTVVVTSDGYYPLLEQTLDSLHRQTFQNFEIIVVQGGSWSAEGWLKSLPIGDRIRHIRADLRGGGEARRGPLHLSRGQYITYIAEGQVTLPYHLDRLVYALDHSQADVVFSPRDSFIDFGLNVPFDREMRRHCFEEPFVRAERFLDMTIMPLATVMHRRAIFRQLDHLEDVYFALSDSELMEHFSQQHNSAYVSNIDAPQAEIPTMTFDSSALDKARAARAEFHRVARHNWELAKNCHLIKSR